jgi:uncharacterized protein YciI
VAQFIVIAYDRPDVLELRRELRDEHVAGVERMRAAGSLLYGLALLDERGEMCGSVMVFELENRAALDRWLATEPYQTGGVWDRVEVQECRVGPMFRPAARPA